MERAHVLGPGRDLTGDTRGKFCPVEEEEIKRRHVVNTVQYPARGRKRICGQRGVEERGRKGIMAGGGGRGRGGVVKERYRLQRN